MRQDRLHPAASEGFERAADAYERGRPDYPALAVERLVRELGLPTGTAGSNPARVVDLGAGTGKFTRLLARATSARIVAVEPVRAMREALERNLAQAGVDARIHDGTAEALPFSRGEVNAVFAAQAFHWFRGKQTLLELGRVLKRGGGIGLIWNRRDSRSDFMARLTAIVHPYQKGTPQYHTGEWRHAFMAPESGFSPIGHAQFSYVQTGQPETTVDRVASISFISALERNERTRVLTRVRELLATHADTRGRTTITIPYLTDVYWSRKRD